MLSGLFVRLAGIRTHLCACWPGPPLLGMLTYSALVTLYPAFLGFAGGFGRRLSVAGRSPDAILTALLTRDATRLQRALH